MRLKVSAAAVLFVGLVQSSFGTTLTNGSFHFVGTIFVALPGVVTPAGTCIALGDCTFWQSISSSTNGLVDITSESSLPPSLVGNDNGNVFSLTKPPEIVGSPFPPTVFMTFNASTGVTTQLLIDYIFPGVASSAACGAPAAVGQVCTPPGSEFTLTNNLGLQAMATWKYSGVTNTMGVIWTADFTALFPLGTPYQTVLNEVSTQGYVSIPFTDDGVITLTTVPEPGALSLMMIATGLIGLAVFLRLRPAK